MLVLSRKTGEEIVIKDELSGEFLTLTLVNVKGQAVRLGFEATKRFRVMRTELLDAEQSIDFQNFEQSRNGGFD